MALLQLSSSFSLGLFHWETEEGEGRSRQRKTGKGREGESSRKNTLRLTASGIESTERKTLALTASNGNQVVDGNLCTEGWRRWTAIGRNIDVERWWVPTCRFSGVFITVKGVILPWVLQLCGGCSTGGPSIRMGFGSRYQK